MTVVESAPSTSAPAAPVPSAGAPLPVRVGAELAGSFFVCFALYAIGTYGTVIQGVNLAFIAVGTGCAYAVASFALHAVSGGQINPAVTLARMLLGRTKVLDGVLYMVAQVLGALAAAALMVWMLPTSEQVPASQWLTPAVNGYGKGSVSYSLVGSVGLDFGIAMAIIVEVVAVMLVVSTALAARGTMRAVALGVAYGVAAGITFPITGAALNPARATGIAVFAQNKGLTQAPLQQLWVFWLAPVLAAAIVALVIIVAQMAAEPKKPAADEPADNPSDGVAQEQDAAAAAAESAADEGASVQEAAAEVREEQTGTQADADHGIERH